MGTVFLLFVNTTIDKLQKYGTHLVWKVVGGVFMCVSVTVEAQAQKVYQ